MMISSNLIDRCDRFCGSVETAKESLEKAALVLVFVLGALLGRGALVLSFFYFKAGADKLVNLVRYGQVTLAELSINVITWISVPNETDDL
jgi:hypothetical protein